MATEISDEDTPFLIRSNTINPVRNASTGTPTTNTTNDQLLEDIDVFYQDTESHQYEQDENEVWKIHQFQRHFEDSHNKKYLTFAKLTEMRRWVLTFVTGIFCGIVALLITYFTAKIMNAKLSYFHILIEKEKTKSVPMGTAFLFLFWCNICFVVIAWGSVYMEPLAAGSGIPEIKCYLNGINIPRLVRLRTLICKAIGIIFACCSGLTLGKEGPMVHIGSIVAAAVSQGKSTLLGINTSFSKYQDFRNDKEKRDFAACGAAAGVAAAFDSPIGGVLFSLEEGSSFWSTKLTWRCFFCAMATLYTVYLVNTANSFFSSSDNTAMFSFGKFYSLQGEKSNYSVWELVIFMLIGTAGGIIGAIFNYLNEYIFKTRQIYIRNKSRTELLEVLLVCCMFTSISYLLPFFWAKCSPLPTADLSLSNDQEKELASRLIPLYCNRGTHYNELASLYLVDSDTAIKQLFHFRELGDAHDSSTFSSISLLFFFLPYILTACITCGLSIPAGMFVPSLLSGAAFGRFVGHCLHNLDKTRGTFADTGTYALMGSAAITGGITRMTISLTVMILEGTGDMQYVLPLMLTVMSAKLVGDFFIEGLYDVHIHCRRLYYLNEDENLTNTKKLHDVTVREIMTVNVVTYKQLTKVGDIYNILISTSHQCYPIIDGDKHVLFGTITRKILCSILKYKAFTSIHEDTGMVKYTAPLVSWETLESVYPKYPTTDDLTINDAERELWIDLRPYIDISAYTINEHASLQRTYRMFRTLGLRHLCIVDRNNCLKGIITRQNLTDRHVSSTRTAQKSNSVSTNITSITITGRNLTKRGSRQKHQEEVVDVGFRAADHSPERRLSLTFDTKSHATMERVFNGDGGGRDQRRRSTSNA